MVFAPLFRKSRTISSRLFKVTLIPLVLMFCVLVALINMIIQKETEDFTREVAQVSAEHISTRINDQFATMGSSLAIVADQLATMSESPRGSSRAAMLNTANFTLQSVLRNIPEAYSAWIRFDPGFVYPNRPLVRSYIKQHGIIAEIFSMSGEIVNDPEHSPWNSEIFPTTPGYRTDLYRYGSSPEEDHRLVGMMTIPIQYEGRVIGCVGLNVLYEDMVRFMLNLDIIGHDRHILLIAADGGVLYSGNAGHGPLYTPHVLVPEHYLKETLTETKSVMFHTEDPENGEKFFVCLYPLQIVHALKQSLMYIEIPAGALASKSVPFMQTIIIISIVGFCVLAVSVLVTTGSIVRPLHSLTQKANDIAAGHLDIRFDEIPLDSHTDEIAGLITALKKMVDQLSQIHGLKLAAITADFERERIQMAASAKNQFFANMSHEIRTPMNAITGLAELLLNQNLTEAQRRYVWDIRVSAVSLLKIINDILDSAKMEAGRLELAPSHYNFPALLDNICSIIRLMAHDKGLRFEFKAMGEMPLCLYGDAERLRQILLNLLNNAVKYTRSGFVRLRVTNEGETLLFETIDSGIGIKEDAIALIFDPYSQVSGNRSKAIEGTGLGLSITNTLVEMMGGTISVTSQYGMGSTFSVRLPLVPGDPALLAENSLSPESPMSWKAHVLLVDDNKVNLNVANGLLGLHGVSCDMVLSGPEALLLLEKTDYDLIFMDHMMPGMDGVQATAAIRAMGGKFATLPIIALTANAMQGSRDMLLRAGMNDFLAKPIDLAMLRRILDVWLPKDKQAAVWQKKPDTTTPEVLANASASVSALLRQAAMVEGLNVSLGLERVCGQADVYETSLRLCGESLERTLSAMRELYEEGDLAALYVLVHGLRGSLANIGAMGYSSEAEALEKAARSGDISLWRKNFPHFADALGSFRASIMDLFVKQEDDPKRAGGQQLWQDLLHRLRIALADYDYDLAMVAMTELLEYSFAPEREEALVRIRNHVEYFAYDEAIAEIDRICQG